MERPALSIRSTKGCWTCRLRKKKCDEIRPGCERCASVDIVCHYGKRPRWIEDPALGKEELARVKAVVGVAASRKRAQHRAKARDASVVPPYPSPSSSLPPSTQSGGAGPAISLAKSMSLDTPGIKSPVNIDPEASWLSTWIKDQEADLIMHYLDHVFYIQFRFHTPSISGGGRGWLLSLLTRTKPLYHAALSLSAFHQQSLLLFEQGEGKTDYLHELERQHNLTLQELQVFIQAESLTSHSELAFERNVQILACIVQLISFELFNGGKSNWQMHLKAASELVLILHQVERPSSPSSECQRPWRRQSPERAGLKFFSCCILWFDILSTVSTGLPANLADHHRRLLLGPTPALGHNIDMHIVCGCHNWVMLMISEISVLAVQRTEWKRVVSFNAQSFEDSINDTEARLRAQHHDALGELRMLRDQYGGPPSLALTDIYNKHTVLVVTCLYASAAIIYLQTIKTPDVSPADVEDALQNSTDLLAMVPEPRMLRALIWPLCMAGCMASSPADQEIFRGMAVSAVNDSRTFGNSSEALEILERSWTLQRETRKLVDCATTVRDMGNCILLV